MIAPIDPVDASIFELENRGYVVTHAEGLWVVTAGRTPIFRSSYDSELIFFAARAPKASIVMADRLNRDGSLVRRTRWSVIL